MRMSQVAAQAHVNVRFVKRAQQLGFTRDDIEDLLHLAGGMRDALARLIETCGESRAERQCPILHDIETAVGTR